MSHQQSVVTNESPRRSGARATGHVPGLDGLRGLACLAVFGVHWQQFTGFTASIGPFDAKRLLENGNTGVAVLFMLSAFLLSRPFWSGRQGPSAFSWLRYARGRLLRIVPAYYACLIALAIVYRDWISDAGLRSVLLHLTFLHTWTERTFYDISPPFWTIGIQAQSYVVMPIVAIVIARATASWRLRLVMLGMSCAIAYATQWALLSGLFGTAPVQWAASQPTVAAHTVLAHLPHFLLGMIAALLFVRLGANAPRTTPAAPWLWDASVLLAAAGILILLSTPLDGRWALPFGRYNLPIVPLAIAWLIVAAPRAPLARLALEWAPLRWLGVISYGVYVYHYACMQVVSRIADLIDRPPADHAWIFGTTALLVSILVAAASYHWFEEPLRRGLGGRPRPAPETVAA